MNVYSGDIKIETKGEVDIVDITNLVEKEICKSKIKK